MEKVILINGSPRAPQSNSKKYAECFMSKSKLLTEYVNITKLNHREIIKKMESSSQVVFVLPLYADGIPSTLLTFLKNLEEESKTNKPIISVLINCGFIEYQQNNVAIEMIKLFCKQNGYKFGSVLSIGGGEAILGTPFKFLVYHKINLFAKSIYKKQYKTFTCTMPLTKKTYIKASTRYWIKYGEKFGITQKEMKIMTIEEN